MSDKNLSGEEKRKLLKEQFKQDLKQRKEFLNKVKNLRRLNNINKALSNMNVQDDTDDWINKLNEESAFSEAKMEIALESAKSVNEEVANEKDIQEFVAEELIKEMKREIAKETGQSLPEELENEEAILSEEEREEITQDRPFRKMLEQVAEEDKELVSEALNVKEDKIDLSEESTASGEDSAVDDGSAAEEPAK